MADLKDVGGSPGVFAGWIALIGLLARLLWDAGDRFEKKIASTIRSSDRVKSAVGEIAVAAVVESGKLVDADLYREQRERRDEKLEKLINDVAEMRDYLHSDQLPRAIVAAMHGEPTRRNHARGDGG